MKSGRFTDEQIIGVLKEAEVEVRVKEICRKHGICDQTYSRWKSKFGGLEVSEARRLRQLEEENRRLKQMVAARRWTRRHYGRCRQKSSNAGGCGH